MPFEVATLTLPCSMETAFPSYLTSESAATVTFDPSALMLTIESGLVCTMSPANKAELWGTELPLIQAVPLAYSMAEFDSDAMSDAGNIVIIIQQSVLRTTE